jgi:hypothetical protein
VTKAQIIEKAVKAMNLAPPEHELPRSLEQEEDEAFVISVLHDRLQGDPNIDIRTCEAFKHLMVECCELCHGHCAHYEMKTIDLPNGGKAWVCGPLKWAIYPEKFREVQKRSRHSPEGNLRREIFDDDVDE